MVLFFFLSNFSYAGKLSDYRIRTIPGKKISVYFKKGIFVNDKRNNSSTLNGIRHSFVSQRGYERFVFDLSASPNIYGSFNSTKKILNIDFKNTQLSQKFKSIGYSKYVDNIDFFPIEKKFLSVKVKLKKNVAIDIFKLKNPMRLVLDIKKL